MIISAGICLISNERVKRLKTRFGNKVLEYLFTQDELDYSLSKVNWHQHCAARFAAKCACYQAMKWDKWRDYRSIEVKKDHLGAPFLVVSGIALKHINKMSVKKIHLTLTHTNDYSIANVIFE
jgi:holo-[acyl-carrier protein] synthase